MNECTFVIAEDDEDDRLLAKEAFEVVDPSMNVAMATDGVDLLDQLQAQPDTTPELVILDLNMPRADGLTALKTIREDDRLHTLPIVVLTTSSNPADQQRCFDAGANEFVTKPSSFDQLVTLMRALVRKYCAHSHCAH